MMHSIIVCFCGIDNTADNGVTKSTYNNAHGDILRRRKEGGEEVGGRGYVFGKSY